MNWITLEQIKQNSRIDFDYDDSLVTRCGNAAEAVILKLTRRTYGNIEDLYGQKPDDLVGAALLLADVGYKHRSPVSETNKSVIPYTFDFMIADYMRLDKATPIEAERNDLLEILTDVNSDLTFNYSELDDPTAEQRAGYDALKTEIDEVNKQYAAIEKPTSNICNVLRQKINAIKTAAHELFE